MRLDRFTQQRKDWELGYGVVGEQFFSMPKNQHWEWVLETLGDALRASLVDALANLPGTGMHPRRWFFDAWGQIHVPGCSSPGQGSNQTAP